MILDSAQWDTLSCKALILLTLLTTASCNSHFYIMIEFEKKWQAINSNINCISLLFTLREYPIFCISIVMCTVLFIVTLLFIDLSYSTRKWLQQYRAIIVKRSIHFRRFYIGAVCQFLPLLTIAISLIICETFVAQFVSDKSIHLTIENTSPSDNRSLFQASFVNGSLPLEVRPIMIM